MHSRIEKIKAFLKDTPHDSFLNHALGLEYIKLENDIEALGCFEVNMMYNPGYVATYYHLAKLLERLGEKEKAINIYQLGMEKAKAAKDMHTYNELQYALEDLTD